MLYGSELIGFQKLHAGPMQRVIDIAVKWIVGLARSNTSTDAFTLCYELGLPPIFLEMSASRARLGLKLDAPKKMKTWIQTLWDKPATYKSRHMTWVSQTKKWIEMALKEKHKYAREFLPVRGAYHLEGRRIVEEEDYYDVSYEDDAAAPLRHWAQLGRLFEMRIRATGYRSILMEKIRAEMVGEFADGAMVETPLENEDTGELDLWWRPPRENSALEQTVTVPVGRTREEWYKLLLIRHVVLERLMTSQKTVGWNSYDSFHFGITRGYLREAVGRADLSEGVRWLVLARTRAFPLVERAWQRITRSGKTPGFSRSLCPLCRSPIESDADLSHLLVTCKNHQVKTCRLKYLEQNIVYLTRVKAKYWESAPNALSDDWGTTDQNRLREGVVCVYLLGGIVRLNDPTQEGHGWFDIYQLGFGHFRLVTPGFTAHQGLP
ncbi:hypothetical protein EDB86DRAFT_2834774 [Lactarius hatsudake]|nr:hypothetical protein EDB86DRAFT_2834774 [Lactarius hatsudake]